MFTHLHLHTEYSLLDGMCRIPDLMEQAKALGMDSLAITDHGALHGAIDFYLAAKGAGIKPIIGCEMYVAPHSRHSRSAADKNPYHLTILARNEEGYRNLIQLATKAHLEGYYYKPRVDRELLAQHSAGLVVLSGCPSGELPRLIQEGRHADALAASRWYRDTFEHYYLEVQEHGIAEFQGLTSGLVALGREAGLPLVATNDVHYIHRSDSYAQDILLCIQTNSSIFNESRMKMTGDSFCLKSAQEMASLFADLPEAVANTRRIAELCDLELEFGRIHLPRVETPHGQGPDEYLGELCQAGLRRRYGVVTDEMRRRLAYELEVIRQTQFANYFLVVWDLVRFARERQILLGVRGSAAGSLVLYCLGVTDIDPLAYNLVFERFLNLERREMPDIDLDFADDRRDEVISYVANKYGHDRVAQIVTFGTLGARAAIRDVGRALGMSYGEVDRVARLVPPALNMTLDRALEESQEFDAIYRQDERVKHLIDTAKQLEGIARHASTHAAGVVISREPLTDVVPLQRASREEEGIATTQFAMDNIARIGLLKMDFLGLANLTILDKAVQTIAQTRGVDIDLQRLPLDDAKTFESLSAGETTGVFQLEGSGMRRSIKELKPSSLGDIAAMIALYRPGPMQHIPTFVKAKHGQEPIRYPHPALEEILKETYGVIVYQDQVLFIVQAFAGYTLGEADIVRKAMGKKIPEVMRQESQRFIEGAKKKGFSPKVATQVWELIEPFAGYAFNKAHSVSYAMIAYQTAYLKANYSAEYMCAVLTVYTGNPDKVAAAVAECHRLGIKVLPPSVNHGREGFALEQDGEGNWAIRFGLAAIKNVGSAAVRPIIAAREEGGPFVSVEEFCRRADLRGMNKRVLESLIKAGALDCLGERGALLASIDRILSIAHREQKLKETGQSTMFDLWGEAIPMPMPDIELKDGEVSYREKLAWEKELLGVYLSQHPFSLAARHLAGAVTAFCGQVDQEMAGQTVVVAGVVSSLRTLSTRDGRPFVSAALEDMDGSLEVTAWPEVYERTKEFWVEGNILLVEGKVRARGDDVQLTCQGVMPYEPGAELPAATTPAAVLPRQSRPSRLLINLNQTGDPERDVSLIREVFSALQEFPGSDPVYLTVNVDGEAIPMELPLISVRCCQQLQENLVALLGAGGVAMEGQEGVENG